MILKFPRVVDAGAVAVLLSVVAGTLAADAQSARSAHPHDLASLSALAAVTGVVRDTNGAPQIGALVQLLGPNFETLAQTFTDDHGRYTLPGVRAGLYQVKASGSLYLPTLREHLLLAANSRMVVNLTLNTFYEAFKWLPAEPRRAGDSQDDWTWTLRLSANRPLLRMVDDGAGATPVVLVSDGTEGAEARKERVTVRSGANRFGQGGMHQDVELESRNDDARQVILRADVAQDVARNDSASIETTAAWRQQLAPGRALVTVASFADRPAITAGDRTHLGARGFGAFTLRSAETIDLGPDTHIEAGTELEAVHLGRTVAASHPFASATHHFGANTVSYRVATSRGAQQAASLDRESTLAPAVTARNGALSLEEGRHQEVAFERSWGSKGTWSASAAYFHDRLEHPVVTAGVSVAHGHTSLAAADAEGGSLVYDPATQMVAVGGGGYSGNGLLAELRDQLTPDSWIAISYATGDAMVLDEAAPGSAALSSELSALRPASARMIAAILGGRFGGGSSGSAQRTEWRASYRWQPENTLTQVDPFSSAVPDAYLSLYLRQPVRLRRGSTSRMQAILDVRNLLAQGYRPFVSQDGSTLYFAQAERCVEGGFSFSF